MIKNPNISNEQLEKLFSQAPGMIYIFARRPDGTYYVPFTSTKIKELFGCSPEDVRNDFSPILNIIYEEDKQKVINSIEESAKDLSPWHCEFRIQLPNEDIRWMFANSIPEKQNNSTIEWYGFNTDISYKKHQEEELLEKNAELQKMNNFMTDREVRMSELKKQLSGNKPE